MRTKLAGAIVGALAVFPLVSSAASLTADQQNAVINLLQSFNVDTQTISTVQAVLSGQTPPATASQGSVTGTVAPAPRQGGEDTNRGRGLGNGENGRGPNGPNGGPGMLPPGQMAKQMCASLNRTMGLGSKGDDVKKLQQFLQENGDFNGQATGTFGPMTQDAMRQFQMRNGIGSTTNGVVGPATKSFLERACGKGIGDGRPQPMIRGAFTGAITANDGSSTVTLQNREGKTLTVTVSASTTIMVVASQGSAPTSGTIADLKVGNVAAAEGQRTGDTSMAAVRIKVGPPMPLPPTPNPANAASTTTPR